MIESILNNEEKLAYKELTDQYETMSELMSDKATRFKRSISHFKRHISTVHEENKPFSCDSCNKKFGHKCDLKRHVASYHEEDKQSFLCNTCGQSFKTGIKLKQHFESVHKHEDLQSIPYEKDSSEDYTQIELNTYEDKDPSPKRDEFNEEIKHDYDKVRVFT